MPDDDQVNNPAHYASENFECIDVIEHALSESEYVGYLKGCVIKYMYRHNYKGAAATDLAKARWYLDRVVNTPTCGKTLPAQKCDCGCGECTYLRKQTSCDI